MADNVVVDNATNGDISVVADEITSPYTGGTNKAQGVKLIDGTADSNTVIEAGGGVEANALRVTLASDSTGVLSVDDNGSTLSVDDGGSSLTVDGTVGVSGTVTVDSELTTGDLDTGAGTDTRAVVGLVGSKSGGGEIIPGDATNGLLVNLGSNNDVTVTGTVTVDGSGATQPVSIASTVTTKETRSGTATTSQVADTASSATLLASNASRLGASITNDSSARLYIKTGTTASATDYTVSLRQHESWEAPYGYTGRIDGIWASDPGDGAARVTEYAA